MTEPEKKTLEKQPDTSTVSEQSASESQPTEDMINDENGEETKTDTNSVEPTEIDDARDEKLREDEIATLKDRLLRAMAETENVRKRSIRDRDEAAKYAITSFARNLLSIADNLRRALSSVPDDARGANETLDNLLSGVEMTEREFESILERHNIRPITPLGSKFNPNEHQALFEVPTVGPPPGTIVEVVEVGYTISDRLLRPASVGVSAKPPTEQLEDQETDTLETDSQKLNKGTEQD